VTLSMLGMLFPWAPCANPPTPAWVETFPSNPDQYIGIGHAVKASHPASYRETAQSMALAQISREISIQVQSENALTQSEHGKDWAEAYSQKITTASQNQLSGYQLEKVYETGTDFWALYTLDKEVYQKALDRKEQIFALWLENETLGLDYDLQSRQIQQAVDRYVKIKQAYAKEYPPQSMQIGASELSSKLYTMATAKIQNALRKTELVSLPEVWSYSLSEPISIKSTHPVEVFLADLATGTKWNGPLSLSVNSWLIPTKSPCQVATNGEGHLDLAPLFLDCGLAPGRWSVRWMGPDDSLSIEKTAQWRPLDLALEFQQEGPTIPTKVLSQFRSEISSHPNPYCRIVSGNSQAPNQVSLPKLEIRLHEMIEDSLEGMYFCAIRGEVFWPGISTRNEVSGKAGHSNRERARSKAVRDLVNAIFQAGGSRR
jgi:hypothetical protein